MPHKDPEVRKEYHRQYTKRRPNTDEHKARRREQKRAYRETEEGKLKQIARRRVNDAIKSGRMAKLPCQFPGCGDVKSQAHHKDYGKPLEVEWYCQRHHRAMDNQPEARLGGSAI